MRKHQVKILENNDNKEAETKDEIEIQFKWLFSFEGMYKIFGLVGQQDEYQDNNNEKI